MLSLWRESGITRFKDSSLSSSYYNLKRSMLNLIWFAEEGCFMLSYRCYLCEEDLESLNHLFIHCKVAKQCWELLLNLCRVVWVMPSDVRSLLESWNGHKITSIQKQLWKTYPCVFLDHLEWEKNHISGIKTYIFKNCYFWCEGNLLDNMDQNWIPWILLGIM